MLDHRELLVLGSIILNKKKEKGYHSPSHLHLIVVRRFVELKTPAILEKPLELRCGGMFSAGTGTATWMGT